MRWGFESSLVNFLVHCASHLDPEFMKNLRMLFFNLSVKILTGLLKNQKKLVQILHDTAGWRNLESSVKCVQALVNGCGDKFHLYVDQSLLDLIFTSLEHPNRFVRETAYQTCATIIEVCSGQEQINHRIVNNSQCFTRSMVFDISYTRHHNPLLIRNRSWILARILSKKPLEKMFLDFKKWVKITVRAPL